MATGLSQRRAMCPRRIYHLLAVLHASCRKEDLVTRLMGSRTVIKLHQHTSFALLGSPRPPPSITSILCTKDACVSILMALGRSMASAWPNHTTGSSAHHETAIDQRRLLLAGCPKYPNASRMKGACRQDNGLFPYVDNAARVPAWNTPYQNAHKPIPLNRLHPAASISLLPSNLSQTSRCLCAAWRIYATPSAYLKESFWIIPRIPLPIFYPPFPELLLIRSLPNTCFPVLSPKYQS